MDRLVRERLGITLRELTLRRPAVPVAGPGLRPRLHRRRPGPVPSSHARRHGHRPRCPGQRAPRHRGPRAQVAAGLLRAGARARRDLPGRPAQGRPGRLRARCCTRRGTPSTSRTPRPSCPSSTATWATTPSPRASPSSSTTSWSTALARGATSTSRRRRLPCASPTVNDLYFMRRYAAKLAYETELHSADRRARGHVGTSTAAGSARPSMVEVPERDATWSTSTTASTAPATCAPGCSKAPSA